MVTFAANSFAWRQGISTAFQGREACRPSGAGTDQVRACNQSQDNPSPRSHGLAVVARPRRRGDRIDHLPGRLSEDEARRIAANIAKPELLRGSKRPI